MIMNFNARDQNYPRKQNINFYKHSGVQEYKTIFKTGLNEILVCQDWGCGLMVIKL